VSFNGTQFLLNLQFFIDIDYDAMMLRIYIPTRRDTFQFCVDLAKTYKNYVSDFIVNKQTLDFRWSVPGDSHQVSASEIKFTGRIFIYYESALSED